MGLKYNILRQLNRKLGFKRQNPAVRLVYDALVQKARQPVFYMAGEVPDSVTGRYEMIILHIFVFFYRLKDEEDTTRLFGQEIFDTFVEDMDRSLREMGVGYQAVPKRMKKMGEAFYGRVHAYDGAVEGHLRDDLKLALRRNIFPDEIEEPSSIPAFADYILASVEAFQATQISELMGANLPFADPAEYFEAL